MGMRVLRDPVIHLAGFGWKGYRGGKSPSAVDVFLVDDVGWSEVKHLSEAAVTGSRTQ
jgi:hypothetical protein